MRKFLRLSWIDRWLLFQAALWLIVMRVALRSLPFRHVQSLFARFSLQSPGPSSRGPRSEMNRHLTSDRRPLSEPALPVHRIPWVVQAVANRIPGTTCLPRALVTQLLLARAGRAADLHVGVGKNSGGRFHAHAWVESGGVVLVGGPDTNSYTRILVLGR